MRASQGAAARRGGPADADRRGGQAAQLPRRRRAQAADPESGEGRSALPGIFHSAFTTRPLQLGTRDSALQPQPLWLKWRRNRRGALSQNRAPVKKDVEEEWERGVEADDQKRVLLAGGAGFIGSHLCDRILARSDVSLLVCVDNLWTGSAENISHIRDQRFRFERCDVEAFRSDMAFDEIYHFASPASPPWYMAEPRRTISANLLGAMRLLDLLGEGGRFGFASTSEVYGDPLVSPQPETYRGSVDCTGPRAAYDEGKRVTEALLFETRRTRGLDLRVTRLFNVYGPRTREDDGRAVSNFITQGLSGRPLTVFGDGSQSRSWGYIDDIIDGIQGYFWGFEFRL